VEEGYLAGNLKKTKNSAIWESCCWCGRLPAHRSCLVQQFVASQTGRIHIEYVPAYAPELNPTEYIWGYCNHYKLPNACPKDFAELKHGARRAHRNMRRRPMLITAFWKQASLWPE